MDILTAVIIGLIAGWLASLIMKKGKGKNTLIKYLIIGVIGAFIGSFVFGLLGISTSGFVGNIISATAGAVGLLYLLKILKI